MDREERIHRWIDGELDEAERARFEADLERDALLAGEVEEARRVGRLLRRHLPSERAPDPVAAFHAGIARGIAEAGDATDDTDHVEAPETPETSATVPAIEARPAARVAGTAAPVPSGRVIRFPVPWAVAAAACLVAAFLVWRQGAAPGGGAEVEVVDAYAPDPRIHADVFFDEEAGATVILLDGLDEIPEEREVKPYSVASYDPSGAAAGQAPVLHAATGDRRPVYVLMPSPGGRWFIRELQP